MKAFVECYSGLMGGGKSFAAVRRMLEHIAGGGVICSNIMLKLNPWFNDAYPMKEILIPICPLLELVGFETECRKDFDPVTGKFEKVIKKNKKGLDCYIYNSAGAVYWLRRSPYHWNYQEGQYKYLSDDDVNANLPSRLPTGEVSRPVLVILDEALDHFESDGKSNNTNAEFRSFLRHIRKLGINLIFIAQDFSSLEKKIRVLTHFVWTFRDMKTWQVPVIGNFLPGGTLPPPWNDNIYERKFHQNQFGSLKAEPLNKKKMVFRDPRIFQCYQSVSLHNANIKMLDKAKDFGTIGKIKRKGKKVHLAERILIYVGLAACLFLAVKAPERAVESMPIPQPVAMGDDDQDEKKEPPEPERMIYCGKWPNAGFRVVTVQGDRRRVYEVGRVVDGLRVVGVQNSVVYLEENDQKIRKEFSSI